VPVQGRVADTRSPGDGVQGGIGGLGERLQGGPRIASRSELSGLAMPIRAATVGGVNLVDGASSRGAS
jgi:hypothetical protein